MRTLKPLAVAAVAIVTLVVGANWPDPASAATVSVKWTAPIKVDSVRSQGTATLYAYTSSDGALSLRLTGLRPATNYAVEVYGGTCPRLGARVLILPRVTATTGGTVTRGLTLSRTTTTRLRTLLRSGHLSVVIGSARRCGTLVRVPLAPNPTPTPTPIPGVTPTPTPMPISTPTPTPTLYVDPTPYKYLTPTPY